MNQQLKNEFINKFNETNNAIDLINLTHDLIEQIITNFNINGYAELNLTEAQIKLNDAKMFLEKHKI